MNTQKTTEPKQNGEMEPTLVGVTVSPEECTLNGNKRMLITFHEGTRFSNDSIIQAVFRGSEGTHAVRAEQVNRFTHSVLIPAHHKPEQVTLSVIVDSKKKSRVIYRSHFLYTAAPEHYIAELLVQSVSGTPQLDALLSFVPPLKTKTDLAAFDDKLTVTFSAIALPRDWTLVGYRNLKRVENGSTLLHFSARLGLVKFTRHLLNLPGAKEAVNMDNKFGMSPVDIASDKSNNDTVKLLNDFAASVTVNSSTTTFVAPSEIGQQQYPWLTGGFSGQQQQQQDYCTDAPVTKGVSHSEPSNKRQDKRRKQYSPTLAKIKPKPIKIGTATTATAVVNDAAKHFLSNLATTLSSSCPTLFSAGTMNSAPDCSGATEFTCASASSTNSDELPCTSSENSPEPSHRHGNSHKSASMENKNGVMMMSNVPKSAPPLSSQHDKLYDSSLLPSQSVNCRHPTNSLSSSPSNSDTREDSVTPVQANQYSDQEGALKHQSSTPVQVVTKCASADSSPSMQRVTSISLFVSKSRPPSQHQVTLLQHVAVEDDDMMATQSAPNILSSIDDHDSLTPITDHDDRSAESSTTPTATATTVDLFYNDNSSHPDCSDSSSDSEVSSINDIHVDIKSTADLDEQQNQQTRRRHSQTVSVKHSASDHCLLERTIPNDPRNDPRKRLSDIVVENHNDGILYSTGSEPVVSKPHISSSDFNLSSTDDMDLADSTDTLDELYEKQSDDGGDDMIQYEQHTKHSGGRPRSADISHVTLHAKMKQMHAISSTPHSTVLRKVYSSSTIDDFHATQSMTTSFRSHNKLHPKLVEEMYSVDETMATKTFQSKIGISKPKKFHPVSRNNSDVTGLKTQASHVSVKRSASAVSDSGYPKSERMLSRDSKDYSSSQESSTLSLRGTNSGAVPLLPPSPLISNITPVELTAPSHTKRRSGTLSPSIPMLPAEDEEPVENVLSQPSIAGIMQSRKPMVNCDPEIESSLDRVWPPSYVEAPAASQKSHPKKTDNKTNLKRAQTMMVEESSHRKFWFRNKKDKEKKKKNSATVKVNKTTNSTSSTYPRPNSASSHYINAQEEGGNPNQPPEAGNVLPVKQVNQRQSTQRMEGKSIHFSSTGSPSEQLVAAAPAGGDNEQEVKGSPRAGASQPTTSTSSSNLQSSKSDPSEPPRKSRSSTELYETEKETISNNIDTSIEEDESVIRAQEVESVTKTFLSYPELWPDHHDNAIWSDNVPAKILSKMNKSERDRQAVIYELIQTENHILVAIQILLIVFKRSFQEGLKLPEEIVEQMFPHLEPLLALTQEFYHKLRQRQTEAHDHVIDRIGDVLVDHFTGDKGDEVAKVYGAFCSRQLRALDIYREQNKVKRFQKLANSFANTPFCQRRNYPEFITLLAQRITKYPNFLARLSKKTDPKHCDAKDLGLALTHSEKVTSQVNQIVDDQSRHEKLLDIQMNLEVHLPRWEKDDATRKELKSLNLMASGRNMIKMGHAKWVGSQHSQELPVLIVLVTDMVVILIERDQKYSLACLQDRKPPVIRLIDLIVRINEASVKSAVCELFLMEGGARPEFYTIQFSNEKELIEWKKVIQSQIEHCKQKDLKCEHFGSGHIPSYTTEDKKDHHHNNNNPSNNPHPRAKVKHDSVKKREKKKGNSKKEKYLSLCGEALELAKSLLSSSPSLQDFTQLQHVSRHGSIMSIPMASAAKNSSADKSSPKTRSRANTIVSSKGILTTDDIKAAKHRGAKSKGTKVERSQTFLGKEEKKDRPHISYVPTQTHHRSSSSASGGTELDDIPDGSGFILQQPSREQLQLTCIMKLVAALEGMEEVMGEQDSAIASLQNELSALKSQLDHTVPREELPSNTENDLLSMINDQLLEKQTMSGMSLEDLRHYPLNAYHGHPRRQQNGSVAPGRPQSYSELPSNDILPSWPPSLTEHETVNFNRTMSTDTT